MFSRRAFLVLVYLATICSTTVIAAPSVEARAKGVAKAAPKPVAKPVAKPPPAPKKPATPPPAAKPPVKPVAPPPAKQPTTPPPAKAPVKPVAPPPAKKPTTPPPVKPVPPPVKAPTKPPVQPAPPVKPVAPPVKPVPSKPATAPKPSGSAPVACVKPTAQKAPRAVGDVVPNQFLIHLKPGVNRAKHLTSTKKLIADAASCDSVKSKITLDSPAIQSLPFYGGIFGPSVVAALKKSPDVQKVVPNTLSQVDSPIPGGVELNVTRRALTFTTTQTNTWSLARLNSGARTVTDAIGAEDFSNNADARNRNTRNWPFKNIKNAGQGVNVYVIDTGVSDHTDLAGRIVRKNGANVATGATNIDDTTDGNGHGTKMAGIIAGATCGVAKSANIIPVKAGLTGAISQMDIIAGLAFAVNDGKSTGGVINISVTMNKGLGDGMEEMVAAVIKQGMHIVNSAGNNGVDACATRIGNGDGPITVGRTDIADARGFTSNFGACLTVWAPGTDIPVPAHNNANNFISGSGTSEAAAHTSGLVATLLSDSKLTPAAMKAKVIKLSVAVPSIVAAGTTNRLIQVPSSILS